MRAVAVATIPRLLNLLLLKHLVSDLQQITGEQLAEVPAICETNRQMYESFAVLAVPQ